MGHSLILESPIPTCMGNFLTSFKAFLKFYLLNKATPTTLFEIATCPTTHIPNPFPVLIFLFSIACVSF